MDEDVVRDNKSDLRPRKPHKRVSWLWASNDQALNDGEQIAGAGVERCDSLLLVWNRPWPAIN